jgi:hypothetical protein
LGSLSDIAAPSRNVRFTSNGDTKSRHRETIDTAPKVASGNFSKGRLERSRLCRAAVAKRFAASHVSLGDYGWNHYEITQLARNFAR